MFFFAKNFCKTAFALYEGIFGLKVVLKYLDSYSDLYYLLELDTDPGSVNTDPNHGL